MPKFKISGEIRIPFSMTVRASDEDDGRAKAIESAANSVLRHALQATSVEVVVVDVTTLVQ